MQPLRLTGQMYAGLPDEEDARAAQHLVYQVRLRIRVKVRVRVRVRVRLRVS